MFKKRPYLKRKGCSLSPSPVIPALLLAPTEPESGSEIIILKRSGAPIKLIWKASVKTQSVPEMLLSKTDSEPKELSPAMWQELGKNKALGSGVRLRKWRFAARWGLETTHCNLENKLRSRKKGYSEFLDIYFCCQLTKHRATFFGELMECRCEDWHPF